MASLSLNKLWRLTKLAGAHPLFFVMSGFATIKTFGIAQKLFPETASTNGIGNAFRHALWSCLILMYCCKISSPEKSVDWCKKMTDMHEELFPNLPLETQMDLHNNQVGIQLFLKMLPGIHRQFFEKQFFIDELLKMIPSAEILTETSTPNTDLLVYLEK